MVSVVLFDRDPGRAAEKAAEFGEAGVDMCLVRPERFDVGQLETFATALEPLLG